MDNLEVETRVRAESEVEAPVGQAREVVHAPRQCLKKTAVVSGLGVACVWLLLVGSRHPAGGLGSMRSEIDIPTGDQIHNATRDHQEDFDRWNDQKQDPCILVRYGCMEMDNQTYCEMAGSYCTWVVTPVYPGMPGSTVGHCIKPEHDTNDACAAQDKDGCEGNRMQAYGCEWKPISKDLYAPGGYCIQKPDAQAGCDLNTYKQTCASRDDCEWVSDASMFEVDTTERQLQAFGLPGLPGHLPTQNGQCRRKEMEPNDCCASLGPDKDTCETQVGKICQWGQSDFDGKWKCRSKGDNGANDDRLREQEEICHNQADLPNCWQWNLICTWDSQTAKCEPTEPPPPEETLAPTPAP